MSILPSLYDTIVSDEQVDDAEIDLLELSAEAISFSLSELDRGLSLVTSLESLYDDTFGEAASMESASNFLGRLDDILSVSGIDLPITAFVSFEADEKEEKKEEPKSEEKNEKGMLSKAKDKVSDLSKKVVNEKTREKISGAIKAIKEWIKQKAIELGKWLDKRIDSVKQTASKIKAGVEQNEKTLKEA